MRPRCTVVVCRIVIAFPFMVSSCMEVLIPFDFSCGSHNVFLYNSNTKTVHLAIVKNLVLGYRQNWRRPCHLCEVAPANFSSA